METPKPEPRIVNGNEVLDHAGVYNYRAEFGTANGLLDCPFCGTTVRVYIWSLAGCGKRCTNKKCNALHGSRYSLKKISTPKTQDNNGKDQVQTRDDEGRQACTTEDNQRNH